MKLTSALVGLIALGSVALSAGAASAMPIGVPAQASTIEQAAYVCNGWGHCWWHHNDGYGFYHPHYYGGWGWHRWHHWHGYGYDHPHYYGGWGWHRWHHWHHWHQW
jgi:hypothetical protein